MSHEITDTDNVMLAHERAWHGLGIVVPEAMPPVAALELIGADWGVRQRELYYRLPDALRGDGDVDGYRKVEDLVANVREDTWACLGLVSPDHYKVFTNREVAEFCECLLEQSENGNQVLCETVGTIRGGRRLWFLLQGASFQIANGDEVVPYVCVSNGHDGKTSLRVTPTTVRVVCSNTLHMVIPENEDQAGWDSAAISIQHTGDLQSKVAAARKALAGYDYALRTTKERAARLAAREVNLTQLLDFFVKRYAADFPVPDDEKPELAKRRLARMDKALDQYQQHFNHNVETAGPSWWNAFNSYSEFAQHDTRGRGADDLARVERRVQSNLFGLGAARTMAAFQHALQLVDAA